MCKSVIVTCVIASTRLKIHVQGIVHAVRYVDIQVEAVFTLVTSHPH